MTTIVDDGHDLLWASLVTKRDALVHFNHIEVEQAFQRVLDEWLASVGNESVVATVKLQVIYGTPKAFKAFRDQL